MLPKACELTLAKLANRGWLMTDTCNAARKFRRLLKDSIREIALEEGMEENKIMVFEAGENHITYFMLHQ